MEVQQAETEDHQEQPKEHRKKERKDKEKKTSQIYDPEELDINDLLGEVLDDPNLSTETLRPESQEESHFSQSLIMPHHRGNEETETDGLQQAPGEEGDKNDDSDEGSGSDSESDDDEEDNDSRDGDGERSTSGSEDNSQLRESTDNSVENTSLTKTRGRSRRDRTPLWQKTQRYPLRSLSIGDPGSPSLMMTSKQREEGGGARKRALSDQQTPENDGCKKLDQKITPPKLNLDQTDGHGKMVSVNTDTSSSAVSEAAAAASADVEIIIE